MAYIINQGNEYIVELNVNSNCIEYFAIGMDVRMWSFSPITYKYVAQVKYANGDIYSEKENEITSNNTLSQYDANLIISKLNQLKEIMNISDNVLQEITK